MHTLRTTYGDLWPCADRAPDWWLFCLFCFVCFSCMGGRTGLQGDTSDPRAKSFLYILDLLPRSDPLPSSSPPSSSSSCLTTSSHRSWCQPPPPPHPPRPAQLISCHCSVRCIVACGGGGYPFSSAFATQQGRRSYGRRVTVWLNWRVFSVDFLWLMRDVPPRPPQTPPSQDRDD